MKAAKHRGNVSAAFKVGMITEIGARMSGPFRMAMDVYMSWVTVKGQQ
jgi:hypothetical protein